LNSSLSSKSLKLYSFIIWSEKIVLDCYHQGLFKNTK